MDKDKLDEIREKLGLNSLDEGMKKDIFNKFVKAGGKVVDINKKGRKSQEKQGESKKEKIEKDDILKERDSILLRFGEETLRQRRGRKKSSLRPGNPKDNPVNKWIERFSSKMGCVLSGILTLNGEHFKNSFRELILYQFQNILMDSRMILASVLYQDKLVVNEIKKASFLDNIFPYNYELIYRFDNLYSTELFDQIGAMRNSRQLVRSIKGILIQIFKSILIIQPYHVYLKNAVESALVSEKNIRGMDPAVTFDNIRKLNSNIDYVFLKVYPKLFSLIDWYYKNDTIEENKSFKNYIKFTDEDVIGYYTGKWKAELAGALKKEKPAVKDAGPDQPGQGEEDLLSEDAGKSDPIRKGLQIMENNIKLRKILNSFNEAHDIRSLFQLKDRVFITLCLTDYFDKEFSFLFNSNKIVLNIAFLDGKRSDMKRELLDSYYKLSHILENVNEYLKIIKEIKKMENDALVSLQERSSRSNQYSLQRSQLSRSMRKEAREFFEEFSKKILFILSDYQRGGKIIVNASQVLEFDKKIDGERYADGKKTIEVIEDAYNFSSAAHFLLSEGDLSPLGLMLEKRSYLQLDLDQFNE